MNKFIIAGAQKCGTTTLSHIFQRINDLHIVENELHYFSKHYSKKFNYESIFNNEYKVSGEKTPNYTDKPSNSYIHLETFNRFIDYCKNNHVKVIFCIRNPICRLESALNHHYVKGRIWPYQKITKNFLFCKKMSHLNLVSKGEYNYAISQLILNEIDFRIFVLEKDHNFNWYNNTLDWLGSDYEIKNEFLKTHSNKRRISKQNAMFRYLFPDRSIVRKIFRENDKGEKVFLSDEVKSFLKFYYAPSVFQTSDLINFDLAKLWSF